jgi:Ca-activated chloride channel family protein
VIGLVPTFAWAQGFLIDDRPDHAFRLPRPIPPIIHPPVPPPRPAPPQTYQIKELTFEANLNDQLAKVQVTQTFANTGSVAIEASFVFPLPYDGAVDRLTFMVDGKEYEAKLLDATEARRIYEGYIRRNQDPALLEWIGTGMFKTSVFPIPPGAQRTVTLRYTQVCRKVGGLTEFLFPMSTARYSAKPVEKLECRVNIQSQVPLKNIYSPTHAIDIKRTGDQQALVSFQTSQEIPASDFRLMYDVGSDALAARVLSYRPAGGDEGYLLLLVSPEIKKVPDQILKKNVVIAMDRSGSMSGKKIEQAKGALRFVLNNLREGDLFNIVAYDTEVESFRPEMQRYDEESRKAALGFVEGMYAGGSTNIDGAMKTALHHLTDASRPNYLLFLTDGLPTVGVTAEAQIAVNAQEHNKVRARIFTFGVGYDVNSRLLDKLARNGFGQSEYVRPNEDIESHVSRLYNRIGAPALTNVSFKFDVDGANVEQGEAVNRVYPKQAYDLFAGDQLVLAGRYRKSGAAKVTVAGTVEGQPQAFSFPAQLVESSPDESLAFIAKIWAMRRVGEIIDQIDLHGKNSELIDELVALSKRHGIITPYTSFLADDRPEMLQAGAAREATRRALESLDAASGAGGLGLRADKGMLQRAAAAPGGGVGAKFKSADSDREVEVRTVQSVGAKTFFLRSQRWVDSNVTPEQEKQAVAIQRYSDQYFALIDKLGTQAAKYLAIEGRAIFEWQGTIYEIRDPD